MQLYNLCKISIPEDTEFLYGCMTADDQYLHSTKLRFWSIQEFEGWLVSRCRNDFHDFYIIKDPLSDSKMGYVYNYDFSLRDGHCKLVVYICPEYRLTGVGALAALGFIKKLFDDYPLRKLYSTIYDYNTESLNGNVSAGFVEEGSLSDYRYYNGNTHRIHYLSMDRETFDSKIRKWVR